MKKAMIILFVLVMLCVSVLPSSSVFASYNVLHRGYIASVNTSNNTVGIHYDCNFWGCSYITLTVTRSTAIQVPDVTGRASIYDLERWINYSCTFSQDEHIAKHIKVSPNFWGINSAAPVFNY